MTDSAGWALRCRAGVLALAGLCLLLAPSAPIGDGHGADGEPAVPVTVPGEVWVGEAEPAPDRVKDPDAVLDPKSRRPPVGQTRQAARDSEIRRLALPIRRVAPGHRRGARGRPARGRPAPAAGGQPAAERTRRFRAGAARTLRGTRARRRPALGCRGRRRHGGRDRGALAGRRRPAPAAVHRCPPRGRGAAFLQPGERR